MIRMAGKRPYEDTGILVTGIRRGEKLSRDLSTRAEARALRKVDKILRRPEGCEWARFDGRLGRLRQVAAAWRRDEIVDLLKEIVPEYRPIDSGAAAAGAVER